MKISMELNVSDKEFYEFVAKNDLRMKKDGS